MRIREITFVRGATSWGGLPSDGLPEVAFAGRSNVGKSSLLNALAGRRGLARTSGTPGKTREFNYYLINGALYFVDLPGFGYAKTSKQERARWARLIERYVTERDPLRLLVHLVDSRREPGETDRSFIEFMRGQEAPYAIALTKCDKLSGNERIRAERGVREALSGLGLEIPVFSTSSQTRRGVPALLEWIGTIAGLNAQDQSFPNTTEQR